jgi:hypothetical protein
MTGPTSTQSDQALKTIAGILSRRPNSLEDLRNRLKAIVPAAGHRVLLDLIGKGDVTVEEMETITLLATELELAGRPEPLVRMIEDETASLITRQLALLVLASGNPEAVAPDQFELDLSMLQDLATSAESMLMGPILEDHEVAEEVALMLSSIPEDDRFQVLERLDQGRRDLMVPAWLAYAYVLESRDLQPLHEMVVKAIAMETGATDVDVWDETLKVDLPEAARALVREAAMRTRTARLNADQTALERTPPFGAEATAWISPCDGVGAYTILVCLYLENGMMNLHNVCLHTSGECRDGFALSGREPEELDLITDTFKEEAGYEFVRFPLARAHELVAEARSSDLNDTSQTMAATLRDAAGLQWAAALGHEARDGVEPLSCDPPRAEGTFAVDDLIAILDHDDFSQWFLNRADLAELGVEIVPPAEADDAWIEAQTAIVNTPAVREKLGLMFEHMAWFYQWRQQATPAGQCAVLARMLETGGESAYLIMIHYLVRSLEMIRVSEEAGGENELVFFGDDATREMLRRICFPRLVHPKGKHLAILDLTEAALIALDREVAGLAASRQPRSDALPHIALAIARAQVDMALSARHGSELPADAARYRRMINAMRKHSGWNEDEAAEMWRAVISHVLKFIDDVCRNCPVFCFGRATGKEDVRFHSPGHPAYSDVETMPDVDFDPMEFDDDDDDDDYEDYEKGCKLVRRENSELLADFSDWLQMTGLSESTVKKHLDNISFFVNEFLLYEGVKTAAEGIIEVGYFLGFWFIRKAMWSSPAAIKANAASLKKFYHFMFEEGLVTVAELELLKDTIKGELPDWLETMRKYADPSLGPEDVWDL